ncbi:MAG: DUF192 domain-containing protein [Gaiellaceae bacterium]
MWRLLLACALSFSVVACGSESKLEGATVVLDGDETVTLAVEVAASPAERERGLMGRMSLAPDSGMVFLFDRPTTTAFVMRDTTIPLSIAFYDRRGTITQILDLDPCRAEPCRLYRPRTAYVGALEVPQGAFRRFGIQEGDRIEFSNGG